MHHEYRWPDDIDQQLQQIDQLEVAGVGQWLRSQQAKGQDDAAIHLVLALASARYVDHHGPFIGHGTFNGGPVLRAASILPRAMRNLALLQSAAYVVDLLHQPNYGPYLLMDMDPITESTIEGSRTQLRTSIASGEQALLSEHRLVGLLKTDGLSAIRQLLIEVALTQFRENEHRLLIVHRSSQLMDDTNGGVWAEPLWRAAVQYLATHPDIRSADTPTIPIEEPGPKASAAAVLAAMDALIEADWGDEPRLLYDMNTVPRGEVIALTGSELLRRSRFDAHAVTGIHCVLDLLHDPKVHPHVQELALGAALLGQRTRRQKASRATWRWTSPVSPRALDFKQLRDVITHDDSGIAAMDAVASALLAGSDASEITRLLMEVALTTAGPFEAIHNVKMLWGQWIETQRSSYPDLAWRHLAAGARVVAETAAANAVEADPIISWWHSAKLSNTP